MAWGGIAEARINEGIVAAIERAELALAGGAPLQMVLHGLAGRKVRAATAEEESRRGSEGGGEWFHPFRVRSATGDCKSRDSRLPRRATRLRKAEGFSP